MSELLSILARTSPLETPSGARRTVVPEALGCWTEEEIAALLESSSGDRPTALRDSHLGVCPECRDLVLVACLSLNGSLDMLAERPGFCLVFEPGTIVGHRYCIKQLLGRGGMGEVYEAFDLVLREPVALKAVRASSCDEPRAIRRLVSEVRLGRSVNHPNVCRLYDLGYHSDDGERESRVCFCTMQLLRGETLSKRLRRAGPLGLAEAILVGREISSGLAAIHAAGIVHRDVKSDNVMLHRQAGAVSVAIVDFGLARRARARSFDALADRSGPSGSVAYMAPEQVSGQRGGPRADIFSFGVVLFEAITGRLPFDDFDGTRISFISRKQAPRMLRLREVVGHATVELDAFVARCLCIHPEQRFADGTEALHELNRISVGGGLLQTPEKNR